MSAYIYLQIKHLRVRFCSKTNLYLLSYITVLNLNWYSALNTKLQVNVMIHSVIWLMYLTWILCDNSGKSNIQYLRNNTNTVRIVVTQ